jgi:ketosteroid isomerase-like protein
MKNQTAWCLLGMISLSLAVVGQAFAADESPEKTVAALEEQWTQSERSNKPELTAPLLAEKLIYIEPDGTVDDRTKVLADAKATKYTSVEIQDFHVTVFGNTAVATMVFNSKETNSKGKPEEIHARWTDTWVKMPDGKWQCVLSQGSNLKK